MQPSAKYLYYPGCSLKGTGIAYEESLLTTFRLLEIPVSELPDWNCCGATTYMSVSETSATLMAARNLALARQTGSRDLLAPCNACYLTLRKSQELVQKHPQIAQAVEQYLEQAGLPRLDSVRVRHPLEVLYNDVGVQRLRELTTRRLQGVRVACYYGCQAVRPYGEVDDPHQPTRMEEILQAVGVDVVDYTLRTKCCGGPLTGTIHDVGVRLNYILLKEAMRQGAQAIVTICPLCQFNLDAYQAEIRKQSGESIDMPILYLTQVVGWALGGGFRELGLHRAISGRKQVEQWFTVKKEAQTYV
ncbi:MAG: CoB--CoM heterodisulfide reductase iron-sulfur subunit B family protein [Chthonomonadetes bacterium]|nr:CoB--CoM heterodisulfide reductase iron-sulfur subunit B family protein [Chthonomonadetes bacterium]